MKITFSTIRHHQLEINNRLLIPSRLNLKAISSRFYSNKPSESESDEENG